MNIGILTWGSEGDVNPFIALASGLAKAGHTVTLSITGADRKEYASVAAQKGFNLGRVDYIGSSEEELNIIGKKLIMTKDMLKQLRIIFEDMVTPGAEQMYQESLRLCRENDLIIGHFIHHPSQAAAELSGKPYVTVSLNHGSLASGTAAPMGMPNMGKMLNRLLWKLAEGMVNKTVLPFINSLRVGKGLTEVSNYRKVWESELLNIVAVSPILAVPQPDWGLNNRVTGFLRMDDPAVRWTMPEGLPEFFDKGEAPVYLTLGSMAGTSNNDLMINETTSLLVDSVKRSGRRGIVQSVWQNVTDIKPDIDIFRVNSAPYTQVFPRCAAVVHHGGAGTTQTALLSGCPSIIVGHIPDQFLWGAELRRIGAGGKVFNRRSVTPQKLAREIIRVASDNDMKEHAKKAGILLREERGVDNAVHFINTLKF